jgi:hypothetical protein
MRLYVSRQFGKYLSERAVYRLQLDGVPTLVADQIEFEARGTLFGK